jgi:hypothetical protein
MKNILFVTGLFMMILFSEKSTAQGNNKSVFNYRASSPGFKAKPTPAKIRKTKSSGVNTSVLQGFIGSHEKLVETPVTRVNIRAVRDFVGTHGNISDAKWFESAGGYVANYSPVGIDTRIVYGNNGKWFYSRLTFPESKMDVKLRKMVKSKYYDHDIIVVYQYDFESKTIYLVRIQDHQSNIETLKICDDEM